MINVYFSDKPFKDGDYADLEGLVAFYPERTLLRGQVRDFVGQFLRTCKEKNIDGHIFTDSDFVLYALRVMVYLRALSPENITFTVTDNGHTVNPKINQNGRFDHWPRLWLLLEKYSDILLGFK